MNIVDSLIQSRETCQAYFFKYISANDAGKTGSHQAGFYMPRDACRMFLEREGQKGENLEKAIRIEWPARFNLFGQGEITESVFKWYGRGTRSEYRLTSGFDFLDEDNVGDILILFLFADGKYRGFLLSADSEIEEFFAAFNLSPDDANQLHPGPDMPAGMIDGENAKKKSGLEKLFEKWTAELTEEFPSSEVISARAREFWKAHVDARGPGKPDDLLLNWLKTEFALFKFIENDRYRKYLNANFQSVDELIQFAHRIINRRKSRAGYSLEHHIAAIFQMHGIPFDNQARTEGNKKPDFILPGAGAYHDMNFPADRLIFLGVKTTCKDRWRQILNEADRIPRKHLFTLQQGISRNQLEEMARARVILVVPERYRKDYPAELRRDILSLGEFLEHAAACMSKPAC